MQIKIGSRGSKLALTQTHFICEQLQKLWPMHTFEIVIIQTSGDHDTQTPLYAMSQSGIFVRKIEEELLQKNISLAVHSMKDLPYEMPQGLYLAPTCKAEDPRDVFVSHKAFDTLEEVKGMVATGSLRRQLQLSHHFKNVQLTGIRGNIDTRLEIMQKQDYDGMILAAAGVHRLKKESYIRQYLDPTIFIPSCTQGLLGLQIREDDTQLKTMLEPLYDHHANLRMQAERAFLKQIAGGCHTPMAGYLEVQKDGCIMHGMLADPVSHKFANHHIKGKQEEVIQLGIKCAEALKKELYG